MVSKSFLRKKGFRTSTEYDNYLAKRRGFESLYDYRNYLAEQKGFKSYDEYQRHKKLCKSITEIVSKVNDPESLFSDIEFLRNLTGCKIPVKKKK